MDQQLKKEIIRREELYRIRRPLNSYDIAAVETWLEDEAQQGYHLVEFKGYHGLFEKGEPERWRYRMQLLAKKEEEPSPELMAEYEQRGWTYAATCDKRFHVWKSRQMAVSMDPARGLTQGDFRRMRRRHVLINLVYILALAGLMIATVHSQWSGRQPLYKILYGSMAGSMPLLWAMELSAVVMVLVETVSALRLFQKLEDREPLERPKAYRGQRWLATVGFVIGLVFALTGFLEIWWEQPWDARDKDTGELKAGAVYVDLRQLDGTPEEETFLYRPETKVHELAPRMWFIQQEAYPGAPVDEQIAVDTEYYHLLAECLTPRLVNELKSMTRTDLTPLESAELDEFWWCQQENRQGQMEQHIVAAIGRNVLAVRYIGPTDLRAQEAYFVSLLRK